MQHSLPGVIGEAQWRYRHISVCTIRSNVFSYKGCASNLDESCELWMAFGLDDTGYYSSLPGVIGEARWRTRYISVCTVRTNVFSNNVSAFHLDESFCQTGAPRQEIVADSSQAHKVREKACRVTFHTTFGKVIPVTYTTASVARVKLSVVMHYRHTTSNIFYTSKRDGERLREYPGTSGIVQITQVRQG